MAIQMVSRYGFNAVRLTNRNCAAQALIATQGARPLSFCPKGEERGFSALYTNPAKPARSTHACWPNFGRLSLKGDGSDIKLDEAGDPVDGGIYGKYSLERYRLGEEVRTLPMHGPSRTEEWKAEQPDENTAALTYERPADEHYPYNGRLIAKGTIKDNGTFLYNVTATGSMITDLAIHTYLTWLEGMNVEGLEGLEYFDGSDWIRKAANILKADETRFGTLTALEKHCILNGAGIFDLDYPSIGQQIRYEVFAEASNMDWIHPEQMILWADPNEGNFMCMEPVLIGRNSINNGTALKLGEDAFVSVGFSLKSLT